MLDPFCKHLEAKTSMYEGIVDSCMYTVREGAQVQSVCCFVLVHDIYWHRSHNVITCMCVTLVHSQYSRYRSHNVMHVMAAVYVYYIMQATVTFSEAKKHFSDAIKSLKGCHYKVKQLAEETESPELVDAKGLPIAGVAEILKVVERSEMKVVFFGRTSNGKSTAINALLKSKVLPSGYGSTTTTVCYIRGQSTASKGGFVIFDGSNEHIPVEVRLQVCMKGIHLLN